MDDVYDLRTLLFSICGKVVDKSLTWNSPRKPNRINFLWSRDFRNRQRCLFDAILFPISQFFGLRGNGALVCRTAVVQLLHFVPLWVGENGVTAGEWWNMLPFGVGKPVGMLNGWLNKNFGNRDETRNGRQGQQSFMDGITNSTRILPKRCRWDEIPSQGTHGATTS